jgi:hypothetical protein
MLKSVRLGSLLVMRRKSEEFIREHSSGGHCYEYFGHSRMMMRGGCNFSNVFSWIEDDFL